MMRDERPPKYRGEVIRTGDEPTVTEMRDRQAAREFVRRRNWDISLTTKRKYDPVEGTFVEVGR